MDKNRLILPESNQAVNVFKRGKKAGVPKRVRLFELAGHTPPSVAVVFVKSPVSIGEPVNGPRGGCRVCEIGPVPLLYMRRNVPCAVRCPPERR